jgi:hypothetical protein
MNFFTLFCCRNILSTTTKAAAAVLFYLFSTTGPSQGHVLPFQGFFPSSSSPSV